MEKKFLLTGFGGQGVLLIGQMIAYGAMYEDLEVTWMPSYGPEMRGGTANCTVIVSDKPIASPVPSQVDVLLAMNEPSLNKYLGQLKKGGDLFINSSIIEKKIEGDQYNVHYVDCAAIAEDYVGSSKSANMVMLGAILDATKVLDPSVMEKTFQKTMKGKKAKFIPSNMKAVNAWRELKHV